MSIFDKNNIFARLLQIGLILGGIALIGWAIVDPRFRGADGFVATIFCLPLSAGMALIILGGAFTTHLRRFAFWLALALAGQAIALQLIDAGTRLHYQHYQPLQNPWLLGFLLVQVICVGIGLATRGAEIWRWLRQNFKLWQLAGVALVFFLPAATVSPQVPVYIAELMFAAVIQALNLGNIILVAWSLPAETIPWLKQQIERLFGPPDESNETKQIKLDRFSLVAALWVIVVAVLLNIYSYEQHPHVPDEVGYLIQARYLANGVLTMPAPPVPDAFEVYLMYVVGDIWYPSPPPGWPAMLAVGVLLGVPWLVNPVLAGLNVLLTYLLLQDLYPRRTARIALFLLSFSPWYVFLGMSFMTHMFTLTCALLAAIGVAWSRRTEKVWWAWLGGIALGMMAIIRPLEALVMALLLGLWSIGLGGKRLKLAAIAGFVVVTALVGALVMPYNQALTGSPTAFPIMVYTDHYFGPNANAIGFGPDRGMGWGIDPNPGHSPFDAMINANLNTFSINIELFGWSIGSLLFIGIILFSKTLRKSDYLMLAIIAGIFIPHFFYYFSGGPDFGARYWFLMFIPCIALTARGLEFLEEKFRASVPAAHADTRLVTAVLVLCLLALINYFPWRAIDKYHDFRGMQPDIRYLAQEYNFGRSLVFIRGNRHPDYASAAVYNPLDLQADTTIYVWDLGPDIRQQVLAAYPDRSAWIIDGPSLTDSVFKVVDGPLTAEELLADDYVPTQ